MNLDSLTRRHLRLAQALSIQYQTRPWVSSRLDRIANAIAETERQIVALNASSGQASWLQFADADHGFV